MQFETGMVVRSKKGRDKGRFYMVCGSSGALVLVTDGCRRTLDAPKAKNPIHLAPTRTVLRDTASVSDSEIRKALSEFTDRIALPKEVM